MKPEVKIMKLKIEYIKISEDDYDALEDTSGAYRVISSDNISWMVDGKYHREDGPAVESDGGDKEWFFHGKLHREDGPAIEWEDGTKKWFINDNLHREDGPAIEGRNGYKSWYLQGEHYNTEEKWEEALEIVKAKRIKDEIV